MKTAIVAVSRQGLELALRLREHSYGAAVYAPVRLLEDSAAKPAENDQSERKDLPGNSLPGTQFYAECLEGSAWGCSAESGPLPLQGGFVEAAGPLLTHHDLLIFISAAAVAVRAIAPHLKGKDKDPAVIVVDEQARFVISLLSGHLGGANEEAEKLAQLLGAEPVITTATDSRGLTAFDDLARRLGWKIENLKDLKKISAALLEDREILLNSDRPFDYPLTGKIRVVDNPEALAAAVNGYVLVSARLEQPLPPPGHPHVILRPAVIAAGVGCRRGVPADQIVALVEAAFLEARLSSASLFCLATGEFKAEEKGLIEAAARFKVPLKVFTREEIASAPGDSALSDFVEKQVGVGAVAEPCAMLGSEGGELVLSTLRKNGVTVALATKP